MKSEDSVTMSRMKKYSSTECLRRALYWGGHIVSDKFVDCYLHWCRGNLLNATTDSGTATVVLVKSLYRRILILKTYISLFVVSALLLSWLQAVRHRWKTFTDRYLYYLYDDHQMCDIFKSNFVIILELWEVKHWNVNRLSNWWCHELL